MLLNRFGFRDFGPDMLTGVGVFRVDLSARPVTVSLAPAKAKFVVMLVAYAILVAIVAGVVIGVAEQRPDGFLIFFGVCGPPHPKNPKGFFNLPTRGRLKAGKETYDLSIAP